MKKDRLVSLLPNCSPALSDADKANLAGEILTALRDNKDRAHLAGLMTAKGADPAEAITASRQIKAEYDAEIAEAEKKQTMSRPAAMWSAIMATIAVLMVAAMWFAEPWSTKEDMVSLAKTSDLDPLATGILGIQAEMSALDQLRVGQEEISAGVGALGQGQAVMMGVQGEILDRLDEGHSELKSGLDAQKVAMDRLATKADLEEATSGLATKANVAEVADRVDRVEVKVTKTQEIVTVGLTDRARCRKGSTEPACVACFATGAKRCTYRRPFRAASARQMEMLPHLVNGKVVEAPLRKDIMSPPKEDPASVPTPKVCPSGCTECPPGCLSEEKSSSTTTHHELVPARG